MVVKEDGTKWACQSCLKGHRVSGCTHTDRPLQFVPKKGRPVSQCQHCRVERKKRSAHVKCDCGEKNHSPKESKCPHFRDADASTSDLGKKELGAVPESDESDEHTCCCHHGEKCTCSSIKKETKDDLHALHSSKPKPHLTAARSEGHLTVFANGHHKPCHRNNNAAHDANAPYRVHKPHPHPVHGLHSAGRRSIDSLASLEKSTKISLAKLQDLATTSELSTQNTSQPKAIAPATTQSSYTAFTIPVDNTTAAGSDDFISAGPSTSEFSVPQMTADFSSDMGWAGLDWTSFNDAENAQPALTYASSNTISELGEHTPPDDLGHMFAHHNVSNNLNETSAQLALIPESSQTPFGQNRWSLPHSMWGDSSNIDFMSLVAQQTTAGTSAMNITKANPAGNNRDLTYGDWAGSFFPSTSAGQSFDINNQAMWTPDISSQQNFDFQTMAGSADVNMNSFDFGQDPSSASFRQTPDDPFFGVESAEPLDFNNDFAQRHVCENWPS